MEVAPRKKRFGLGETLNPRNVNSLLLVLTFAQWVMTGATMGMFRFSSLWGNVTIALSLVCSTGFDDPIGDRLTSAKLGMLGGFLFAILPQMKVMRSLFSPRITFGIGSTYVAWHGYRYVRELEYVEDAGED